MIEAFLQDKDPKWQPVFRKVWQVFLEHLPAGFEAAWSSNLPSFVVPLTTYPPGYHCSPASPLPFISLAINKQGLSVYHMGIYADPVLLAWFQEEYPKHMTTKLNMGKSCIRFTNPKQVPYDLLKSLASKMSPDQWIQLYEENIRK